MCKEMENGPVLGLVVRVPLVLGPFLAVSWPSLTPAPLHGAPLCAPCAAALMSCPRACAGLHAGSSFKRKYQSLEETNGSVRFFPSPATPIYSEHTPLPLYTQTLWALA